MNDSEGFEGDHVLEESKRVSEDISNEEENGVVDAEQWMGGVTNSSGEGLTVNGEEEILGGLKCLAGVLDRKSSYFVEGKLSGANEGEENWAWKDETVDFRSGKLLWERGNKCALSDSKKSAYPLARRSAGRCGRRLLLGAFAAIVGGPVAASWVDLTGKSFSGMLKLVNVVSSRRFA
ncbi:hypothetical protein K438DRAFT_1930642 [Mycena galopus ATCC 62051]|nr:hypothetical protein K438DRAFT_1930642 [Mycena galopus ATCC 62051]